MIKGKEINRFAGCLIARPDTVFFLEDAAPGSQATTWGDTFYDAAPFGGVAKSFVEKIQYIPLEQISDITAP